LRAEELNRSQSIGVDLCCLTEEKRAGNLSIEISKVSRDATLVMNEIHHKVVPQFGIALSWGSHNSHGKRLVYGRYISDITN
jgi:hypothetical protein